MAWAVRAAICAAGLVCLGVAGTTAVARAEGAAERARQHNAEAKQLFNLGRFAEAATEYTKAYRAKPLPAFLYNLGQCHKRLPGLEHAQQALFFLEAYLNTDLSPSARSAVKEEIAALRQRIASLRPRARPAVEPATGPPPQRRRAHATPMVRRWWFWAIAAAVVGGSVAAVALSTGGSSRLPAGQPYTSADFDR